MNTEMSHPATEPGEAGPSPGEDLNVTLVATVGIVAAIALFVLIVGIQAWFFAYRANEQELKTVPNETLQALVASQNAQLEGKAAAGAVPIELAMDQVVQRYAAGTPAPAEKR